MRRRIISILIGIFLLGLCLESLAAPSATLQELQNDVARLRFQVEDNGRRISKLEEARETLARVEIAARTEPRLAVLEDNMFEIKWLSRTVAGALVVQLLVNGAALMRRKNGTGS